jgi:hypothetical protein
MTRKIYLMPKHRMLANGTLMKIRQSKCTVIIIGIEHGNDTRMEELTPFKNENMAVENR